MKQMAERDDGPVAKYRQGDGRILAPKSFGE
jgi:hypothetical protein